MRIVTRPDFDGIVCAVLLRDALAITEPVKWVEPNQIHRGNVDILPGDIIANLAYDPRCSLWFDHHSSNRIKEPFLGSFKLAPSAARIIFEFYQKRVSREYSDLVDAADKIDSASLSPDEVSHPEKYPYIMISNTLSGWQSNQVSYWDHLVKLLGARDIEAVIQDPLVSSRIQSNRSENSTYKRILRENTRMVKHVSITDLRSFSSPASGNRFLVFSLFPESSVNLKIRHDILEKDRVVVSIGRSIFNKSCLVNIGKLCSRFGGGGHPGAGSCSFPLIKAAKIIDEITEILLSNTPQSPPE